jgi:hypothetical protein
MKSLLHSLVPCLPYLLSSSSSKETPSILLSESESESESKSEPELLYYLRFTANQFISAPSPLTLKTSIYFPTEHLRLYSLCNILSDERMDLSFTIAAGLASAVILESESRETRDHILLSQNWDSPNLEGQSPSLYPPGRGWPGYTPRQWVRFRLLLWLAGLRWRYSTQPPHRIPEISLNTQDLYSARLPTQGMKCPQKCNK